MKNSDLDLNGNKKLYETVKSDENVTIDNMDSSCLDELYLLVDDFKNNLREKSREQITFDYNTWTMLKSSIYLSVLSEQLIGVNI